MKLYLKSIDENQVSIRSKYKTTDSRQNIITSSKNQTKKPRKHQSQLKMPSRVVDHRIMKHRKRNKISIGNQPKQRKNK